MRTLRPALAAVVSAVLIAGCGGEQPAQTDASTKPAEDPRYKGMLDEMKSHRDGTKTAKP